MSCGQELRFRKQSEGEVGQSIPEAAVRAGPRLLGPVLRSSPGRRKVPMGQVTASVQVASERQVRENVKVSARSKPQKDGVSGRVRGEAGGRGAEAKGWGVWAY